MIPRRPRSLPSRLRVAREDAGSTLVEVLVSLMVLATGIVGAFAVFPKAQGNAATAQNLQVASQLATDSIEQLRGTSWATLKSGALRHATNYPAAPPVTDRVTFTSGVASAYKPSGKPSEPMVASAAATATGQPLDYERVTVGTRQYDVYRFASWRTESCPLISLTQLLGGVNLPSLVTTINTLRTSISTVSALLTTTLGKVSTQSATVNTLLGTGTTSLANLSTTANGALSAISSFSGALTALLGTTLNNATKTTINQLNASINSITNTLTAQATTLADIAAKINADTVKLTSLDATLASVLTQLNALQSASAASTGLLSGGLIDLCQLPDDFTLPDLDDLGDLTSTLSTAGTTLDNLGLNGTNTLKTLGTSLDTLGSSLTTLTSTKTDLKTKLSTLTTNATSLASSVLSLTCGLLPLCVTVQNNENGLNASGSLTYSGSISVPGALASSATTIGTVDTTLTGILGQTNSATTAGSGLLGIVGALTGTAPVGNTIRVSVAVLPVNLPDGIGPEKPVWITSVITNPSAKLL